MPAYVISEVEVLDEDAANAYREIAIPSILEHGGRFLARGGAVEVVEGAAYKQRIIIIEFPSMAAARAWYASSRYAPALAHRARAFDRRLTFIEGVAPPA